MKTIFLLTLIVMLGYIISSNHPRHKKKKKRKKVIRHFDEIDTRYGKCEPPQNGEAFMGEVKGNCVGGHCQGFKRCVLRKGHCCYYN